MTNIGHVGLGSNVPRTNSISTHASQTGTIQVILGHLGGILWVSPEITTLSLLFAIHSVGEIGERCNQNYECKTGFCVEHWDFGGYAGSFCGTWAMRKKQMMQKRQLMQKKVNQR